MKGKGGYCWGSDEKGKKWCRLRWWIIPDIEAGQDEEEIFGNEGVVTEVILGQEK